MKNLKIDWTQKRFFQAKKVLGQLLESPSA